MRWLASAAGLVIALSITLAAVMPPSRAVVTGGIVTCAGIPNPDGPRYTAGTVKVYRGDVITRSTIPQPGAAVVLPTSLAAQQPVGPDGTFRFDLEPGRYVLVGDRTEGPSSYAAVTLQPGDDLRVDIPNWCI